MNEIVCFSVWVCLGIIFYICMLLFVIVIFYMGKWMCECVYINKMSEMSVWSVNEFINIFVYLSECVIMMIWAR